MRLLLAGLLLSLALAGCSSSATTVNLVDYAFQPTSLTVAHGQAVHFVNTGSATHSVTIHNAAGDQLADKTLGAGQTYDFTFPSAGDYHVFCRFHSSKAMEMVVHAT